MDLVRTLDEDCEALFTETDGQVLEVGSFSFVVANFFYGFHTLPLNRSVLFGPSPWLSALDYGALGETKGGRSGAIWSNGPRLGGTMRRVLNLFAELDGGIEKKSVFEMG